MYEPICIADGCQRTDTNIAGLCHRHYHRQWKTGDYSDTALKMLPKDMPFADRIRLRTVRDEETGCLVWQASRNKHGYGTMGWQSKTYLVHRLVWTMAYGPIPPRMEIVHTCDNPPCVELDHLWMGTHSDNMRDMTAKGRQRGGRSYGHGRSQSA